MEEVTFFKSPAEFRQWLEEHHARAGELWVGFFKKNSGEAGTTWAEAVDQALCFGWIDGVRKRLDDARYAIRFSPRKPTSSWSAVNIARVGELTELGLMRPAGLKAFEERDRARQGSYSYEAPDRALGPAYEAKLRANAAAWEFFQGQAPSYRRAASWWVMSAKREETRQKRLATLIADSEQGRRLAHLSRGSNGRNGRRGETA